MEFNEIIDYIKIMNEKDKLKLAIRMNETVYTDINYNKNEMFRKYNTKLKDIDEEYRKYQTISKYILMVVARISELNKEEQNQICLYLFNNIKI